MRYVGIAGRSHRLETHAPESFHSILGGESVLQCQAESPAEALDEARESGAFLAHLDEDLAGLAVLEEADGEVALVTCYRELVGDRIPRGGE